MDNLNNIDIARQHARQMAEECLRLQTAAKIAKDRKRQQTEQNKKSKSWQEVWSELTGFGRRML